MRKFTVVVTKTAEDDLAGIADYLSGRLGNPKAFFREQQDLLKSFRVADWRGSKLDVTNGVSVAY